MANFTQLRDLYAVPGFLPATHVHGLFGDPYAVVIPLKRLRKKRPAESAVPIITPSTIRHFARSATSTADHDASTSKSPSAAFTAGSARP